MKMKKELHSV